jgi:hypothetical protein
MTVRIIESEGLCVLNLDAEGADTQNSDTRFPFGALREPLTTGEKKGTLTHTTNRRPKMNKDEGLNPTVSCGFSRDHGPEHEIHAPCGVTDPFVKREKPLDNANEGLVEL